MPSVEFTQGLGGAAESSSVASLSSFSSFEAFFQLTFDLTGGSVESALTSTPFWASPPHSALTQSRMKSRPRPDGTASPQTYAHATTVNVVSN